MDLNGIYPVAGTVFERGHTVYAWNPNGTLQKKEVYADAAHTQLMYRKSYTWNPDGTLNKWEILVATDCVVHTKTFVWDTAGNLVDSEVA